MSSVSHSPASTPVDAPPTGSRTGNAVLAPVDAPMTGRGLGFGRLMMVELRKQVDTRAGRGMLIAIALITLFTMAVTMWVTRAEGASMSDLLAATTMPQGILLPILGIITVCNEWSQRTALVTFSQEPRRWRVLTAKAISAMVLGTGVLVLSWLLAAVAHAISSAMATQSTGFDLDLSARDALHTWLVQMLAVLQGVGYGALLMSVPLAIVAYFLVPTLWSIVTALWSPLRKYAAWLDIATAQMPLMDGSALVGKQWLQLLVASLIWIGLPLAAGYWRTITREVK